MTLPETLKFPTVRFWDDKEHSFRPVADVNKDLEGTRGGWTASMTSNGTMILTGFGGENEIIILVNPREYDSYDYLVVEAMVMNPLRVATGVIHEPESIEEAIHHHINGMLREVVMEAPPPSYAPHSQPLHNPVFVPPGTPSLRLEIRPRWSPRGNNNVSTHQFVTVDQLEEFLRGDVVRMDDATLTELLNHSFNEVGSFNSVGWNDSHIVLTKIS